MRGKSGECLKRTWIWRWARDERRRIKSPIMWGSKVREMGRINGVIRKRGEASGQPARDDLADRNRELLRTAQQIPKPQNGSVQDTGDHQRSIFQRNLQTNKTRREMSTAGTPQLQQALATLGRRMGGRSERFPPRHRARALGHLQEMRRRPRTGQEIFPPSPEVLGNQPLCEEIWSGEGEWQAHSGTSLPAAIRPCIRSVALPRPEQASTTRKHSVARYSRSVKSDALWRRCGQAKRAYGLHCVHGAGAQCYGWAYSASATLTSDLGPRRTEGACGR